MFLSVGIRVSAYHDYTILCNDILFSCQSVIIDQKFVLITVIKKASEKYLDGCFVYLCQWEYGKCKKTMPTKLKDDHIKSCGDSVHQTIELKGQKFGRLTVAVNFSRKNRRLCGTVSVIVTIQR